MGTIRELNTLQALPLDLKVKKTQQRIREWVNHFGVDGVYVAFSGGKDSTVLLHLVRELYPDVVAVFCDTGLEYPEIREFVKTHENVTWLKPKMNFREVINKYGYPMISKEVSNCVYNAKQYFRNILYDRNLADPRAVGGVRVNMSIMKNKYHIDPDLLIDNGSVQKLLGILPKRGKATLNNMPDKDNLSKFNCDKYLFLMDAPFDVSASCCNIMKKDPFRIYEAKTGRVGMIAVMASESRLRTQAWLKHECNAFDAKHKVSHPMAFWTNDDVLMYIYLNNIKIASVYGDIVADNLSAENDNLSSLELFDEKRPKLKTTGCSRTGCMFCGFGAHLDGDVGRFERLKKTHPKQYEYIMRQFCAGGLGFKTVIDWINENGNMNIRY